MGVESGHFLSVFDVKLLTSVKLLILSFSQKKVRGVEPGLIFLVLRGLKIKNRISLF
jgi:hypothetical protein